MSEAVQLAIITGAFALIQSYFTRKTGKHLQAQDEVLLETKELVNGKSTALEKKIESTATVVLQLKEEVARQNREGTPTPATGPGVVELHGVVTTPAEGAG